MTMTSTERVLALLNAMEGSDAPDAALTAAVAMCAALRRIATDFAPGPEPPHWYDLNHPDFTEEMEAEQKHGRWQVLTEVQAAILEELQR